MASHQDLSGARRIIGFVAAAALVVTAGAVQAVQVQPGASLLALSSNPDTALSGLDIPATIQPADWIHKPTSVDFFNLVPGRLVRSGKNFEVVLQCKVLPTSMVTGCTVISDSEPSGVLGQAAIRVSMVFRIKPRMVNGTLSDNAWVRIPLGFNYGPAGQAAPTPNRKGSEGSS